jgi:hypothetical protein
MPLIAKMAVAIGSVTPITIMNAAICHCVLPPQPMPDAAANSIIQNAEASTLTEPRKYIGHRHHGFAD